MHSGSHDAVAAPGVMPAPTSAADDDWFARLAVAELTIELATKHDPGPRAVLGTTASAS